MLRVRTLAGEEVASIPVMELSDVMALKQQLHRLHGLPTRFRQRLFHGSNLLEDAAKLDSPLDLDLVLLPYVARFLRSTLLPFSVLSPILQTPQ